jgi:hypothetical protein
MARPALSQQIRRSKTEMGVMLLEPKQGAA